ncbi:MAG: carboxylating nicotinate-nucleotide diphosphorylase [Candidatus Dormibacteraeota bacterium]|nr:carboxylating nicotinate-nucleotide diphosphorylase [Candidatus Dormibacteraeota bacterium]
MGEDQVAELVRRALAEDLGPGDITTDATVPEGRMALGRIKAKAPGVLAGLVVAEAVFRAVDPGLDFEPARTDGARVAPGDHVAVIGGSARSLLRAERTALNFLQHLSGIATATAEAVRLVQGTGVRLLDTRKTLPGLRALEKYAVTVGGGHNHRVGLWDHYLVKDNHVDLAGGVRAAVEAVRRDGSGHPERGVEVEVRNWAELEAALEADPDRVMLDNFSPGDAARAVARVAHQCEVEISGGVTLETLRAYASAHPDFISVGWLTHSAPALDLSLTLVT